MTPYYFFVVDASAPWVARTLLGRIILQRWAEYGHEGTWFYWEVWTPKYGNVAVTTVQAARARVLSRSG